MVLYSCQICKTNIFILSAMRKTTVSIHQWQDHSPWSVLSTLQHLPPLSQQQQQQCLGRLWPLLVPLFLQLPPQLRRLLLGIPVPLVGVPFTQNSKQTMFHPKQLGLNRHSPQKNQKSTSKNKRGGKRGKNLLLLWTISSPKVIQMLGIF